MLLGVLYIAFGVVLVGQPVASALILTYVLGLLLLISGFVRILIGISHWREAGWIMLLSGVFGVLAGLVILTGFPMTGLWVLGFLLGVDLISHGIGWLAYAWLPTAERPAARSRVWDEFRSGWQGLCLTQSDLPRNEPQRLRLVFFLRDDPRDTAEGSSCAA